MFTDMVGYTALGQRNESLSFALVEEQRKIIRPILARNSGREVKTIGDAFLVEFPSALDAVRCAYEIQRMIREFNVPLPEERRVHLRVGIHLGDVMESEGDISGDAVNIASRIESLAQDGGVCVTRQVYDQVKNKLNLELSTIGSRPLKNVNEPLEVFKMVMPWERETPSSPARLDTSRLAVLPFANISPDPADEYFADGLTEELISKLSLVRGLKVIARTSVMGYKRKEKKISEIGTELGVGTVVEGSVRKAGNRIRVTAQLIDVGSEEHLWASSYDKDIGDIFQVQVDIANKIAESIPGTLAPKKSGVLNAGGTTNVAAFSRYLKAKQLINQWTVDSLRQALELLTEATNLDPSFARAYVEIGNCYAFLGSKSYVSFEESVHGMKSAARRALEIDRNLAEGHALLSFVAWAEDDHIKDEEEAKRAIELNPNLADAYLRLAVVKAANGYLKEAMGLLETAHALDPLSSEIIGDLGRVYYYIGKEGAALDFWEENRKFSPWAVSRELTEYFLTKGDYDSAEREIKILESMAPGESGIVWYDGMLSALRGNRQGAQASIENLRTRFKGGATVERNIGYIEYCLGDMDAFFSAMFRAVDDHVLDPIRMRYSPFLEKARRDIRYVEVLKKNGLNPELRE